jgi:hypothetical protein
MRKVVAGSIIAFALCAQVEAREQCQACMCDPNLYGTFPVSSLGECLQQCSTLIWSCSDTFTPDKIWGPKHFFPKGTVAPKGCIVIIMPDGGKLVGPAACRPVNRESHLPDCHFGPTANRC